MGQLLVSITGRHLLVGLAPNPHLAQMEAWLNISVWGSFVSVGIPFLMGITLPSFNLHATAIKIPPFCGTSQAIKIKTPSTSCSIRYARDAFAPRALLLLFIIKHLTAKVHRWITKILYTSKQLIDLGAVTAFHLSCQISGRHCKILPYFSYPALPGHWLFL